MITLVPNTLCPYSNITFQSIVDELNTFHIWSHSAWIIHVLVVEGDAIISPPVRPSDVANFFIVTLVADQCYISRAQIFSDLVVSRKVSYRELKNQMIQMIRARVGSINSESPEKKCGERNKTGKLLLEDSVLTLLLQGYTLKQTAIKMNLPYRTASRYKIMAVERSGFRNFNELLMHWLKSKSTNDTYARADRNKAEKQLRISATETDLWEN